MLPLYHFLASCGQPRPRGAYMMQFTGLCDDAADQCGNGEAHIDALTFGEGSCVVASDSMRMVEKKGRWSYDDTECSRFALIGSPVEVLGSTIKKHVTGHSVASAPRTVYMLLKLISF